MCTPWETPSSPETCGWWWSCPRTPGGGGPGWEERSASKYRCITRHCWEWNNVRANLLKKILFFKYYVRQNTRKCTEYSVLTYNPWLMCSYCMFFVQVMIKFRLLENLFTHPSTTTLKGIRVSYIHLRWEGERKMVSVQNPSEWKISYL